MAVDICIRGAGVVGMSLALLLARARIRVGLVRAPSPVPAAPADIRAFALNTASRELLTSLRAWPELACAVQHMRVQGDGATDSLSPNYSTQAGWVNFDAAAMGAPALAHIVDASALEQRLQAALSFAPDITLLDAPVPAALTVVCEGQRSASRTATGLVFEQTAYGQTAIAATLETELPHQATAWQWMQGTPGNTASSALTGNATGAGYTGEVCALLPRQTAAGTAAGAAAAGNSVALVWSVEHAHAQELLALDDAQFAAQLQTTCASALGAMRLTSHRAAWPLQLAQASRWVGVGLQATETGAPQPQAAWALAGDAAHAVHPLAGQGLNLGLADAAALARIVSGKEYFRSYGDMRLLRRYERERSGQALALRLATDGLQRLFALDHPAVRALRNAGMRGFNAASPLKNFVMRQAMGA